MENAAVKQLELPSLTQFLKAYTWVSSFIPPCLLFSASLHLVSSLLLMTLDTLSCPDGKGVSSIPSLLFLYHFCGHYPIPQASGQLLHESTLDLRV